MEEVKRTKEQRKRGERMKQNGWKNKRKKGRTDERENIRTSERKTESSGVV